MCALEPQTPPPDGAASHLSTSWVIGQVLSTACPTGMGLAARPLARIAACDTKQVAAAGEAMAIEALSLPQGRWPAWVQERAVHVASK